MHIDRRLLAVLLAAGGLAACGSNRGSSTSAPTSIPTATSAAPAPTAATITATTLSTIVPATAASATSSTTADTVVATHDSSTTTASVTASTTTARDTGQIALWPAPDVVFTTPQDAARDFLAAAFSAGPVLGQFRGGDQGSGEIDVFASDQSGAPIGTARSTLQLRQLGSANGWFVIGAISRTSTITMPKASVAVPAGPLQVRGAAQGFEANIGVGAFVAGHADPPLDVTSTLAGNFGVPLPYEVTLDLTGAAPGDTVVILVHGGVGLETDPGDFSAIAVTISG